jgi:hypothetical protein
MSLLETLKLVVLITVVPLIPLLVQIVALYAIGRGLWQFTGRSFGRGAWALLALVGVPVHELSHAIAFTLTGAGVQRMVLFAPRGLPEYGGATGVVVPARPPSGFSKLVSSVAPFFGCSLGAWLALRLLLPGFVLAAPAELRLSTAALQSTSIGQAVLHILGGYLWNTLEALLNLNWGHWQTYLAVYLGASLGMGAAPSREDFGLFFPALMGLMVILLPVVGLLQTLNNPQSVLAIAQRLLTWLLLPVGVALGYATVFSALMLLGLVLLWPLRRLLRR